MSSENEFREILGDKLNGKQFSFDGAAWEQARDLIDATREKKRRRPFIWLFFGLLVILSGAGVIFMLPGNEKKLSQHASNEPALKQSVQQKAEDVQSENNPGEAGQKIKSNEEAKEIRPVKEEKEKKEKKEQIKNAERKIKTGNAEKNDKRIQSSAQKRNRTESKIAIAVAPAKIIKKKEDAPKENAGTEKKEYTKSEIESAVAVKRVSTKKEKNNENGGAAVAKGMEKQENRKKEDGTGNVTEKGKDTEVNTSTANTGIQADTNKTYAIEEPVVNAGAKSLTKPGGEGTEQDTSHAEMKSPANVVIIDSAKAVAKADSASVSNALPKSKDPYHFFSGEAGVLYLYGWQNPGVRDANGYNPYIGINYSTHVYQKFWLGAGIGYYSVRNLSYSEKTSEITRFGLGEQSIVTVITPSTLHYSAFNLKLTYNINKNSSVGLGYYYSYLFDVAVKKETYQDNSGAISGNAVTKDHGYMQGFRKTDNLLSVYYRRRIWRQLSANAECMLGLNDVKDNAFFNSSVYERNFGFKCSLIYDIIRK
jgi:hypothetical protein